MSAVRIGERFRWPSTKVLVIGLGLVPWPVPGQDGAGTTANSTNAKRTDMVVVIEPRLSAPHNTCSQNRVGVDSLSPTSSIGKWFMSFVQERRVVITGMGVVCPLGLTLDDVWNELMLGTRPITPIQSFPSSSLPLQHAAERGRLLETSITLGHLILNAERRFAKDLR